MWLVLRLRVLDREHEFRLVFYRETRPQISLIVLFQAKPECQFGDRTRFSMNAALLLDVLRSASASSYATGRWDALTVRRESLRPY